MWNTQMQFSGARAAVLFLVLVVSTRTFALSVNNFAVTNSIYEWNADMEAAVQTEFGPDFQLADWNHLVQYFNEGNDVDPLLDLLRPQRAWVSRNGDKIWRDNRHYFVNVSDHNTPSGFLVHDHIDDHLIDLGSFSNPRAILAFTPVPLPAAFIVFLSAFPLLIRKRMMALSYRDCD